ncbi:MAG: hypothetical protein HOD72_09560 [Opitutae bacterium]|nr:hypothetical protein [Opitutae bacterium]MBT4224696.1 hypothetical protein [Opitutae bacterium]MBT5380590.1 hypothetical protein [Opitutae bacterium]MBT5692421.1 hypothetical protein [Opitutae bacterium]MBT6463282.1 hypothetical protein [Opitutae bacterium]
MRPFRYRLQLLMELREKDRDTALQAYAGAMNSRLRQEGKSKALGTRIKAISHQIQDRRLQNFPASMHSIYYTSLEDAKKQLKESNVLLIERRSVEEDRRKDYLKLKSKHDVLHQLSERKREEHIFNEFKAEEKVLEDLANNHSVSNNPLITPVHI